MTRRLRPDPRRIATVSVALFLILFTIELLALGAQPEAVIESTLKSGSALGAVGFFWAYFEKHGWRYEPLRLWGWLSDAPILHGRWEGSVCRDGEGEIEHAFVIEISQTFSSIKYRTFGSKSSGESLSVTVIPQDDLRSMWTANCVWQTTARRRDNAKKFETFQGASKWDISIDETTGHKTITDRYFTSRGTSGTIAVKWTSPKLTGKFK